MIVKVPIVTDHRSVAEMHSVKEKTYMGVSKTTNGQNERKKKQNKKHTQPRTRETLRDSAELEP